MPVAADETDKDYTLSVYAKTSGVTGTGANFRVYFKDASGNYIYNGADLVIYDSKTIGGTTDWTRLSTYFKAPANTAAIQIDLRILGAGTVYFDGAELVYGRVLDNYYSNENASLEWGNLENWTMSSLGTGDGKSSEIAKRGSYSLKLNGNTASKNLGQYVEVQGNANDPLTISGWAYSTNPNPSGGYFALDVVLRYNDGTEDVFIQEFDKSRANQWQMLKSTIRAQKAFYQAKVYVLYYNQTGAVYFDNIKLEERSSLSQKAYDSSGNFVTATTDELNNRSSFNFDSNGNLLDSTDASSKKASFVYDLLNKLKSATLKGPTLAEDIQTSYIYDAQGNLKSRTDPNGRVTNFDYNAINKAVTETDPLGKFITYDYDENGNLKSSIRGKGANTVQSESYTYDRKNRLLETYVGGVKQFTNVYNFADDKTQMTLADGVTKYTYSYDANHRVLTAAEPGNSFTLTNEYGQTPGNSNGMRVKYTETMGGMSQITSFSYDELRRMTTATGPRGGLTEFFYNEQGAQSRIKNGATEIYQDFDNAGRLTGQTVIGSSKLDLKNSYYANGQVNTYKEDGTTHTFVYDFAKRLASWNNGTNTVTYNYDKAGNLKNPHGLNLTFNEVNEVIGYLYDDAGNLTQDNKYKYTWDQQGQLTTVKNLSDTVLASYTYHPNGLRKTKTVGSTMNYHYDETNLIRITNGSGATVWTFTWADGKPVSMTNASGTTFYYVTNFRGDVIRIMDGNGNFVASYSYDPWGKVLSVTENAAVAGQPIRYASYAYDTETQLYYLQARYYDPETARFVSRDPDGGDQDNPISQNLYAYGNDDPVNNVDPDGQWAITLGAIGPAGWFLLGALTIYSVVLSYRYYAEHREATLPDEGGVILGRKVSRERAAELLRRGKNVISGSKKAAKKIAKKAWRKVYKDQAHKKPGSRPHWHGKGKQKPPGHSLW
ncbi:RHS repeat domain-containing protein [Desulfosporosinus meridiei]|uniref:RHS repeat-associated core domain protein n=1 Tax=Desulfosporosinus meridiei (strain ATCC BAA-275 / DSM 13257 / KCTC 12902 / NCIMB 13706 / S10) TaxID=768704 RepID=J7IQU2_DESMD|nr:RHS repeat-associated core domain-containing protein [Desulfosporosinus meridiei]AFQ43995.1 RHS repeat-associated core domain protein [Desulfosporosinus meridiei DSM 13257]